MLNFRVRTFFLIVRTGQRDSLYTGFRLTHNAFTSPLGWAKYTAIAK